MRTFLLAGLVVVVAATSLRSSALKNPFNATSRGTLPGLDTSSYQGNVNWAAVAGSGQVFGITKATEGTTYTDAYLAANFAGMKANGMVRGAYHFGHPSIDAVAQAQYFVNAVNAAGGMERQWGVQGAAFEKNHDLGAGGYTGSNTLQLVLDLEDADGLGPAAVWAWVQAFLGEIQSLTGRPGIIYTGYYFWRDNVGNPSNNLNCPLWLAAYDSNPLVPDAWPYWTFWQYSDAGKIPGVNGNVDVDEFAGSLDNLHNLCFP